MRSREDRNQKSFIALLNYQEFFFKKIDTFIIISLFWVRMIAQAKMSLASETITPFFHTPWDNSAIAKIETLLHQNAVCGVLTRGYTWVNAVSANQRQAK